MLYPGLSALGPKMYIGHAALGTKIYPGLYAPSTRGHADLGVIILRNFKLYISSNVKVFYICTCFLSVGHLPSLSTQPSEHTGSRITTQQATIVNQPHHWYMEFNKILSRCFKKVRITDKVKPTRISELFQKRTEIKQRETWILK